MEQGLKEKTGQDLNHWVTVLKKSGLEKHKAMIDFLKAEHGFTKGDSELFIFLCLPLSAQLLGLV